MLSGGGGPPQVLLITSPAPREGKSTVSANLAVQLAQQGRRVLLVDADLRRSTLQWAVGQVHPEGLSTYLPVQPWIPSMAQTHPIGDVQGLFFMPPGPVVLHPAELLASDRFRQLLSVWRDTYDFIVVDSPPILAVTDSVILAPLVDQILLVARYPTRPETTDLRHCYRLLRMRAPETPVGIVMNGVKRMRGSEYYNYTALDATATT